MAYSVDLRNKALNFYEQCKNISQTAATFNLSRNTLYLWIRLKKQTGSLFWSAQSECAKSSEGDVFEPVESG